MPVKALSKLFRAKFRDALRQTEHFANIPASVWSQDWVVHCKPVGNGVAPSSIWLPTFSEWRISNSRILKLENDQVTFRYQDTETGRSGYVH